MPRRRWQRRVVITLIALFGIGVIGLGIRGLLPDRRDRPAAERALARSLTQWRAGSPSGARAAAAAAVAADPGWGLGHAVLARMQLAQDDALAANASLDRAAASGFDMGRVHQLRARASLLSGDFEQARRELSLARPVYASFTDIVRAELATATGDHAAAALVLARATAERPGDGAAWLALARARRAAADLRSAITAGTRAVELAPGSTDALTLRGELVRDQYGPVASLPWFERALAQDPRNHAALIQYAATLGDVGRTRDMLRVVRQATRVRSGSAQALYLQAVLAARAGRFDLARDIADHAGGAMDDVPGMMLLKGILNLQGGEPEQAIVRLRALVAIQPMNITARRLLASAYARSDASRNAIGILGPVVARADADPYSLTLAARAHERIGEREQAARLIDRAAGPINGLSDAFTPGDSLRVLRARVSTTKGSPPDRIALIRGLIAAGDMPAAVAEARALVTANPGVPAAYRVVGDVAMLAKRPVEAAAAFSHAATLRFDEASAMRLIEAQGAGGDRIAAARTLALFLSQNPQNRNALRLSAQWQLAAGEWDAAVVTLEGLRLRLGNGDAALLSDLGTAYTGGGDPATARLYAQGAFALAPQNAVIADRYGTTLLALGDRTNARDLLRKAAALAPGNTAIAGHLRMAMATR